MIRRCLILPFLALLLFFAASVPGFAADQLGHYGLGAGMMFPDISDANTDNSLYYLFDYNTMDYLLETDYVSKDDLKAWLIHADYLYPLTGIMQSEAYVGFGYSYLFSSSDNLNDDNGINLCVGLNLQEKIDACARYLFLGGGDHILTVGATYYFQ
jgi:hypothetical protein